MNGSKIISLLAVGGLIGFSLFYHDNRVKQIEEFIVIKNPNPQFTKETITRADVENGPVTIFTATWCGYCKGAKQLLNQENIAFTEIDVEQSKISRSKMKEIGMEDFYVPQIFVDGVAIGGFSDLKKIFNSEMPVPKVEL